MSADNTVLLIGRATKDPVVNYTTGEKPMATAKFSIAVDRHVKDGGADFPNVVAFGKNGEFAEKYVKKGTKIVVKGHIQTGSYTNKEGVRIYTTDIVAEEFSFAESKSSASQNADMPNTSLSDELPQMSAPKQETNNVVGNGFISIPVEIEDDLPFAKL